MATHSIALLFAGQGSQFPGMGRGLWDNFPAFGRAFEEASDHTGLALARMARQGEQSTLNQTEITQPLLLAFGVALARVLGEEFGVVARASAGHSLGEWSALVNAGVCSLGEAAALMKLRGALMQQAVPSGQGAMAAMVGASSEQVDALCAQIVTQAGGSQQGVLSGANYNEPKQTVISGSAELVQLAVDQAKGHGIRRAIMLEVSAPFHCALMAPAAEQFAQKLTQFDPQATTHPVYANIDAKVHTNAQINEKMAAQIVQPVQFVSELRAMEQDLTTDCDPDEILWLECTPKATLAGFVKRTLGRSRQTYSVTDFDSLQGAQQWLNT